MNLNDLKRITNQGGSRYGGRRRPWWVGLLMAGIALISYYARKPAANAPPKVEAPSVQRAPSVNVPPVETTNRPESRSKPNFDIRPADTAREPSLPDRLPALIAAQQTGPTIVQSSGTVVKVLPDDTEGDQHQRFIVKLASGETILIAHNIDLANRPPVRAGDAISFKGEFIWNDRGGVVHWTHRDPRHHHTDGWIELNGRKYD